MNAISTDVIRDKSPLWAARCDLVRAMLDRGYYFVQDTSREGYGWWCNLHKGSHATGPSVEKYEGARGVLNAAAKETG